ncbi:MAG: T9SS type A sorting domain-containing protein [Balneolaceae bacterium]
MYKKAYLVLILFFLNSTIAFAQVDYDDEIQPIFNQNCVSCHGGTSGVTLSSYDAVMNSVGDQYGTDIVVPGEPDESPLVDKIETNPDFGVRMPQGGPNLSNEEINLIRDWIEEGANEVPVSNEIVTELPDGFKLNGNYPNPFNPTTVISFEVPEAVAYRVHIYTIHGALVEEIAGNAKAGEVSVSIELNDRPSGVYFYQVIATAGNEKYLLGSKSMTLVK